MNAFSAYFPKAFAIKGPEDCPDCEHPIWAHSAKKEDEGCVASSRHGWDGLEFCKCRATSPAKAK